MKQTFIKIKNYFRKLIFGKEFIEWLDSLPEDGTNYWKIVTEEEMNEELNKYKHVIKL